jgi:hypothetical protein
MEPFTLVLMICVVLVGSIIVYKIIAGILSFLFKLVLFAAIFVLLFWIIRTFI